MQLALLSAFDMLPACLQGLTAACSWRSRLNKQPAAMALTTSEILLKHVCPGLGVVIAFVLFSSPLKVRNAVQHHTMIALAVEVTRQYSLAQ
jgi:hypothetical protein